ncbi:MAG: helix-turn-helix transcriptional regulator [Deltaproteobacteria bacterium]|jgi:DNA-binding HxlR family transcriptional regulator|nr:helix-turn-helix transcriptional regulator [Deltaproteobacteria bacterium]
MEQRIYGYYCPVAHALGAIGERWSLLIVRDLLNEPKRFTDLLNRLGNITPKWLTLRLRHLEDAGAVERVKGRDRRETWYKLTPAGQELRPVIESLWSWGLRHASRSPLPGEVVHPDLAMSTLAVSLNNRNKKVPLPRNWLFKFTNQTPFTLSFDGDAWVAIEERAENPDVTLEVSPEAWTMFLTVTKEERIKLAKTLHILGTPDRVSEFMNTFGVSGRKEPE